MYCTIDNVSSESSKKALVPCHLNVHKAILESSCGGVSDIRHLLVLQASQSLSCWNLTPFTTHALSVEAAARSHTYVMQYLGKGERTISDAMDHIRAC